MPSMKDILFACVLLCLLSYSAMAQSGNSSQSDCHQLDDSKPWLYVEFEKTEKPVSGSKTKAETIVLRLNNNSACDLTLLAMTPTIIRVVRMPDTGPRIERTNQLLPNVLSDLDLRLIDWRTRKSLWATSGDCLRFDRLLPSGQSTIFAAPAWLFKKYAEMAVNIEYRRAKASEDARGYSNRFIQKVELPPNINVTRRRR
jgi:hypothetical protein